jgi:hypothetical protein
VGLLAHFPMAAAARRALEALVVEHASDTRVRRRGGWEEAAAEYAGNVGLWVWVWMWVYANVGDGMCSTQEGAS